VTFYLSFGFIATKTKSVLLSATFSENLIGEKPSYSNSAKATQVLLRPYPEHRDSRAHPL